MRDLDGRTLHPHQRPVQTQMQPKRERVGILRGDHRHPVVLLRQPDAGCEASSVFVFHAWAQQLREDLGFVVVARADRLRLRCLMSNASE